VLFALGLAAVRRDRVWLAVAATAAVWVMTEIAFAYHGWSAVARYLFEPGAVLVVLAGAAAGRVLAYEARRGRVLRWAPAALVLVLVLALVPAARSRARIAHAEINAAHHAATELTRLQAMIAKDGGAAQIKACGQPVTPVGDQSELAWAIGLNVGNVGYQPGRSIDQGTPIVLFKPHDDGWQVRPIHTLAKNASRCERLRTDSQLDSTR
jgi:hypothetical protein